jgi:tetraacyldisaccharide 4'-kinase
VSGGISAWLERRWYGGAPVPAWLGALEWSYKLAFALRRHAYARGWLRSTRLPVPVIVVGNLTAGGTGKTPLVAALALELSQRGWRPGLVLRGYGGTSSGPDLVNAQDDPARTGDEAIMLARATGAPVAIAHRRAAAGALLVERSGCDVLVCDDGLQHWALARDLEIAVVDGARRFGNGRLLPAGPLREPVSRLARVDFVVNNGGDGPGEVPMRVEGTRALALGDPGRTRPLSDWRGRAVHAVAGIGNPGRFFDLLAAQGIEVRPHPLPDHHVFSSDELAFGDDLPVFVTEKDAVKCAPLAGADTWVVPVEASLPAEFADRLHTQLHAIRKGDA